MEIEMKVLVVDSVMAVEVNDSMLQLELKFVTDLLIELKFVTDLSIDLFKLLQCTSELL
jgi:hypothetical protein